MRNSKWARGALAALCLGLVFTGMPGNAVAESGLPGKYAKQTLEWKPCLFKQEEGSRRAECALVTVPRDWADPTAGPDLQVSISRVKATGQRLGAMLINPGGPGGQGTPLAGSLAALQPEVSKRYDFIGMDPRGTGQAGGKAPEQQGFRCVVPHGELPTRKGLDARDRSPESIAAHQKLPEAIAEACQRDPVAPYLTTWQTAHDMDLIRALLGDEKLNYLGYSYGTWLGAKYASMFPERAGKMILDSNVDWQGRLQAGFEDWPRINQRWFDQVYLPWVTRMMPKLAGSTVPEARQIWEQGRAYVSSRGISPDSYDSLFVGNGSMISWMMTTARYTVLLKEMRGQDPATAMAPELYAQLDERSRAEFGVPLSGLTTQIAVDKLAKTPALIPGTRYAVACGDQPTRSADWYRELSAKQGPEYPLFGWVYGLSEPCGFWSREPREALPNLPADVADNVLVVQGEFDPQTGYEQGKTAVDAAPGVSMVSVDDSPTHGHYAMEGNTCVDGMVNMFLLHNSRPGNTTCPSLPLPGEQRVFPVDGPVESSGEPSAAEANPDANQPLRELLQELIGEANGLPTK